MDNTKKFFDFVFNKFFGNYLNLRKNENIKSTKLPDLNKTYLHSLNKYYQLSDEDIDIKDKES